MRSGRATLAYVHDVAMTGLAFAFAMYLRVGSEMWGEFRQALLLGIPVSMACGALIYRVFGLYRGIWRYASMPDLTQVVKAASAVCLATVLVAFLASRLDAFPRSVPLIQWFVLIALLGGPRFGYRLLKDGRISFNDSARREGRVPVLLVGAGDEADHFIRALTGNPHAPYWVVGVVDDKGRRVGRTIQRVPVLGTVESLAGIVEDLRRKGIQPQRLVLTRQHDDGEGALIRSLLEKAEELGLTLSRLPSLTEFKDALGEGKIELRPVAVEDLLGRPQARLDRGAISDLVAGRRVLVTGAGGTIGGELTRQIAALGPAELTMVDFGEFNLYTIDQEIRGRHPGLACRTVLCDVRDRERVLRVMQEAQPELVFHAAAFKHVPLVELNPDEGILTNAIGTRNVADAASAVGTRAMVLISTDKAVNPTSVMGASKRIAEAYCQALDMVGLQDGSGGSTRFMTVRFGNVLGSSGSVVPLFQRQLAAGGPLTVTHPEMRRFFMTVREAVELVLQASAYGWSHPDERGRVFVLDMGEPVRIVDLARQMIRLAGLRPDKDVRIEFTGLRPGEKLFEEILLPSESFSRTESDGIFRASPRVIDYALISKALRDLEAAARAGDVDRALALVGTLVPDFKHAVLQTQASAP
ncbi:polysaccharide biosynthesis protein [Arenibaculum pallidiluteum]|uniref:polysaccharide biosynthesis protein n=1 Tax=Arenibaculum pallidiluteum TaxID=2812559 RepID=UPI001A95D1EC|nr:nucleoside-diphosphate sugar epimerase/dehydratase [Arenibaculum pallidiluteum]